MGMAAAWAERGFIWLDPATLLGDGASRLLTDCSTAAAALLLEAEKAATPAGPGQQHESEALATAAAFPYPEPVSGQT